MKKLNLKFTGLVMAFGLFALLPGSPVRAAEFDDSISTGLEYPAWFRQEPINDLARELQIARATGKQGLMVVFGTSGCSYCEVFLRKSLGNPALASMVKLNFASVYLEIFDDADMVTPDERGMSINQFAKLEGVQFSPTLLFYDTQGKRILRVMGYQSPERFRTILGYVIGEHYKRLSLHDYFTRHEQRASSNDTSGDLMQDAMFKSPPYNLQHLKVAYQKPILVIFAKPGCRACDEFQDEVLDQQQVRNRLAEFKVVRLDITDDTTTVHDPDGRRTTSAAWYDAGGFTRLPALVFYNERGKKVLETDALVKRQRMLNAIGYVIERAYEKDWTYQRFARAKGIEKSLHSGVD